ncbi:MAG: response regulator transcription factor [Chitinophagales bacterium]|nr:response regulator transcription factor [Chitinophagales bacterium]
MVSPITIMLFDDNKRIRDSLEILFTSHSEFEWLGAHRDASQATVLVGTSFPDVVLMDINMPGISGIESTYSIKRKFPDQVIMMLTIFDDDDKVFNAICAGAVGYIVKSKSLTHY